MAAWRTTVIVLAILIFMTIINAWLFPLVPWFEFSVGILNIAFFFVVLVALWCLAPRNSPDFILTTTHYGGGRTVSSTGMLTQIWMFIGMSHRCNNS
jgi:choline transport protein